MRDDNWIVEKGQRVVVPKVYGRRTTGVVSCVHSALSGKLTVSVLVDGCSSADVFAAEDLSPIATVEDMSC